MEAVTDSLSHELGSDGRVDTTADGTENLTSRTDQVSNSCDLLFNECGHSPVLFGATDADSEILEKLGTLRSV